MKMDRLLEIANEAGFMIEGDKAYVGDAFDSINDILKDFALMIIDECISECEYASDNDALKAAESIMEHFGVE
jgi:hypothetical protein